MALVASTVAGLGTPAVDGAEGIVQVSTGTRELLRWNLPQGAWVGRAKTSMKQHDTWGMNGGLNLATWAYPFRTEGAGYIDTGYGFMIHQVLDAHLLYGAGLRLQEHLVADLRQEDHTETEGAELALTWYSLDDGDAFLSPETPNHGVRLKVRTGVGYGPVDQTQYFSMASGWQPQPEVIVPTKNFYPELYVRGRISFRRLHAQYRWVAGNLTGAGSEPLTERPPLDPKMLQWFDARSIPQVDTTAIETWADYSSRRWHLTQPTVAKRPVVMTEGGKRFVRFDGVNDSLATITAPETATGTAQPLTVFLVMRQRAEGGGTQVWVAPNTGNSPLLYRGDAAGMVHTWAGSGSDLTYDHGTWPSPWTVWSFELNGAGTNVWEGLTVKASGNPGAVAFSSIQLGNNAAEAFPAAIDVAAMIFAFVDVSDVERSAVVTWLGSKFGVTV